MSDVDEIDADDLDYQEQSIDKEIAEVICPSEGVLANTKTKALHRIADEAGVTACGYRLTMQTFQVLPEWPEGAWRRCTQKGCFPVTNIE